MPPPAPLQPQIEAIFNDAQQSLAKHRRCAERLRALQRKADARAFAEALFACIACVLPIFKREPAAERVVEFVVRFLTEAGEDDAGEQDELIGRICLPLLGLSDARDKAVRFRVSQLVGRIMNAMPEEAEVSDDLFVAVEERMLRRCRDKVPVVRACALRALFRLQDPSGPSDAISSELLRMMEHDSSPEVRMAAISTVAPSKPAIRGLLSRTRDVTEAPNRAAPRGLLRAEGVREAARDRPIGGPQARARRAPREGRDALADNLAARQAPRRCTCRPLAVRALLWMRKTVPRHFLDASSPSVRCSRRGRCGKQLLSGGGVSTLRSSDSRCAGHLPAT